MSRRSRRSRTVLSEMVTRRARDTAALVASVRVHKAEVAAALGSRWMPALRQDEAMPDHELTLDLAGRSVQAAFDRLDELDDRHHFAKASCAHEGREVDRLATVVGGRLRRRLELADAMARALTAVSGRFRGVAPSLASRMGATPGAESMPASIDAPICGRSAAFSTSV